MAAFSHLLKLAIAAAATTFLLYSPSGYADVVQIFPPQLPSPAPVGTLCPPNPSGYAYTLIWDGLHNVECGKVPTSCQPGQGLKFDGSNFVCVTPCAGPVTTQANVQSCPDGQTGTTYDEVVTQCDGSSASTSINNCGTPLWFPAVASVSCMAGETVLGYYDSTGSFNIQCNEATACRNYTCTPSGLVPQ